MFYFGIKNKKTGKMIFSIGTDPEKYELTLEQREEKFKKDRAYCRACDEKRLSGVPSSKKGRDIYIGRRGVLGYPGYVLESIESWFLRDEVWYSEEGVRFTEHSVMMRW